MEFLMIIGHADCTTRCMWNTITGITWEGELDLKEGNWNFSTRYYVLSHDNNCMTSMYVPFKIYSTIRTLVILCHNIAYNYSIIA